MKIALGIFSLLLLVSGVESTPIAESKLDFQSLEDDSRMMEINRLRNKADKSFEITLMQRDTIFELIRKENK